MVALYGLESGEGRSKDKEAGRDVLVGVERGVDDSSTTTAGTGMTQRTRSREWKNNGQGSK